MIVINTLADIQRLKDAGTLDRCVISYLQKYFDVLSSAYSGDDVSSNFSLERYGPLVFLEVERDAKNLDALGLHKDYLHSKPEYVEHVLLQDEHSPIELYCSCIATSNEYLITLVSISGTLDAETERFLRSECGG